MNNKYLEKVAGMINANTFKSVAGALGNTAKASMPMAKSMGGAALNSAKAIATSPKGIAGIAGLAAGTAVLSSTKKNQNQV